MFPASQDQTSKNAIYIALRRLIIMGHHRPGERFDVETIARQYSTSVTPVREALQMLSQEGLVNIKPRSGYFVSHTTLKQLHDLLDLRRVLEIAAVEGAAKRIQDDQIAALTKVHSGYTGDDDEAYDRYTDENHHFHYLLAKASGNNELAETIGRLHDRLARFMVLRHAGKTMELTHQKIIDALKAHNVEAARQALLDDITDTYDLIMDKVIQEESEAWPVH
jgi:GntR family transcriptional regulator, rspAB operon transcriptional repressor